MSEIKEIGKGRYGKVSQIKIDDKSYAMKDIELSKLNLTEIDILYNIECPFLLKGSRVKIDDNIYTEIYNGDLEKFSKNNIITFSLLKTMIYQLVTGLACLHKLNYLHLDLRPKNILFKEENNYFNFVISDFGFSIKCEDVSKGITLNCKRGTTFYMPYDLLESIETKDQYLYNDKSDIWSLGVTFLKIINPNFGNSIKYSSYKEIYNWYNENLRNVEDISLQVNNISFNIIELEKKNNMKKYLVELLEKMLKKDNNSRISTKEILFLDFFNDYNENQTCISKRNDYFIIPYSSTIIIEGINKIRENFKTKEKKIRNYFFAIDLWVVLCSLKKPMIEEYKKIINYALNYYSNQKLSEEYDLVFEKYISKNKYYYRSIYLDDLLLIDELIFKNYNLLSLYNFINFEEFIKYCRDNYEYNTSKLKDVKCIDFFKYDLPIRKGDLKKKLELVNIKNIVEQKENLNETFDLNENNFKKLLHDVLYDSILKKYTDTGVNLLYKVEDLLDTFDIKKNYYKLNGGIRLFTSARKYLKLNLSIIINKEGILYNELNDKYKLETYNVFIDDDNVSLIYRSGKDLIHYYSKSYPFLKAKFNTYRANFKYGSNCLCKFMDACIVYIIYLHQNGKIQDFNQIELSDNTLKLIMLLGFFD